MLFTHAGKLELKM